MSMHTLAICCFYTTFRAGDKLIQNVLTFPVLAPGSAGMETCFVNLLALMSVRRKLLKTVNQKFKAGF